MINKKSLILIASIACFTACIGDFWVTFVLGDYKPGYSQLRNTMSLLGVTTSPVSGIISLWWIILGLLIILFAIGFGKAFGYHKRPVQIATWLIISYGVGEGLGSGLFKDDLMNKTVTLSGDIHEILGGIGTSAILILPFIVKIIIPRATNPGFHTLSLSVFILGVFFLAMFLLRLIPYESNDILLYKGLWQRLFILVYYIYLMVIAVIMIKKSP
jgi:hypothetical protein